MLRDTRPSSICSYLMRPQLQAVALLLAVSVSAPAHAADIYKWIDKDGGQHYSEQPPAGVKYEIVSPRYAPPVNPPAAQQPKSEPQNVQKKADQERQQQDQQQKAEAARVRQQNCETVQQRLTEFESHPRIRMSNPDGTVERLTEEERQAKIAELQAQVKKYCE